MQSLSLRPLFTSFIHSDLVMLCIDCLVESVPRVVVVVVRYVRVYPFLFLTNYRPIVRSHGGAWLAIAAIMPCGCKQQGMLLWEFMSLCCGTVFVPFIVVRHCSICNLRPIFLGQFGYPVCPRFHPLRVSHNL